MPFDPLHLLHQAFFGGIAAAGFGILFNFGFKQIYLCFISGAFTLFIRTLGLDEGWSLEAASFVAAVSTTLLAITLLRKKLGTASNMVALSGCIPMVPWAFFAQAILGLFTLTTPNPIQAEGTIIMSVEYILRVAFTVIAIGAGISIPTHILRNKDF